MHTKEDIQKTCQYCDLKTANVEYHIKIFHFDEYVKNHANAPDTSVEKIVNTDVQSISKSEAYS